MMTSKNEKGFFSDCVAITERDSTESTLSPTTVVAVLDIGKVLVDILPHSPVDGVHSDFYGLPPNPFSIYYPGGPRPNASRRTLDPSAPTRSQPWTSIDPVRFAEVGKEPGSLFLWVGMMPKTLSRDDAKVAAVRCKEILAEYEINDVEIAFRESVFTRSAGPQLLDHVPSVDPTADVRNPFTPALMLTFNQECLCIKCILSIWIGCGYPGRPGRNRVNQ
ncbi:hypothetical protein V8B97DRAFT_2009811 [Scleroderma yunnanense]